MDGYWRTASWKTMREDSGETIAPDIVRIGGKAGSGAQQPAAPFASSSAFVSRKCCAAIIFTESLAHGTLPW